MASGKVKFFNSMKRYGFVTSDEGEDFFFHENDVKDTGFRTRLIQGDLVTFTVRSEPKGKRAVNIARVAAP
jgi:CspA family cold shock protein